LKKLLLLLTVPLAALGWWAYHRKNEPPQIPFAKVIRETLVSTLPTNGKAEPVEWQAVRVEQAGLVRSVPVQEGQAVGRQAVLASLTDTGLQADLAAAQARVEQARADLATIEAGGKRTELTSIENDLARARLDRDNAPARIRLPRPPGRSAGGHPGGSANGPRQAKRGGAEHRRTRETARSAHRQAR